MKDFEIKVGDLVKLRDDLEDRKSYGYTTYVKNMKFKGFKKIERIFYKSIGEKVTLININNHDYEYTKEMIAEVKRLTKYETIYKREEPILDDKEKEYLSSVIRPFRDKVEYIAKRRVSESQYIFIRLKNGEYIALPNFKEDTMYKNMELQKNYILKELGL